MGDVEQSLINAPGTPVSLVEQVAAHVRQHIATNRLKPGDMLPGEADISRELKVSRPVVREAWNGLTALGVLEVSPGRRPRVARLIGLPVRSVIEQAVATGQATPIQILELRRGIEVQMAGLAAQRRSAETLAAMSETIAGMTASLSRHERYAELDARFHLEIARGSGNPLHLLLVEACTDAFRNSMRAGLASRVTRAEIQRVHANHLDIFRAIEQQDQQQAIACMSEHFDDAVRALLRKEAGARAAV